MAFAGQISDRAEVGLDSSAAQLSLRQRLLVVLRESRQTTVGLAADSDMLYTLLVPSLRQAWRDEELARREQARAEMLAAEALVVVEVRRAHISVLACEQRLGWAHGRANHRQGVLTLVETDPRSSPLDRALAALAWQRTRSDERRDALVYRVDPLAVDGAATLQSPSLAHLLGTDTFGRDILARIIHAGRLDFFIAFSVTGLAFGVGTVIGALSGYAGGWLDELVMRIVDVMLSFPAFILALAITVMMGNHLQNVIGAIAFAYTPYFVRLTRSEALKIRDSEYADAARVVGNPPWRVALVHVFPNVISPGLVLASIVLGWAILDASALGFLGIGIRPPTAEWGTMVAGGVGNHGGRRKRLHRYRSVVDLAVPRRRDPHRRARLQLGGRWSPEPCAVGLMVARSA